MRLQLQLDPMPCPRPRIAVRGRFPVAYYPKPYQDWKVAAAKVIRAAFKGHHGYEIPVHVTLTCNVKRPKSTKLEVPKPDVDNYAKSILDAMTAAEVWTDDTIVSTLTVRKRWADVGSIEVLIEGEYIP
jgi:Holliday junction resolvase RusA-like endonuclease